MKRRILCVDDEIDILAIYQRQLMPHFDVVPALGGEQGLATIKASGPFPVIVSDMRMPGMSGAEFLAQARALAPDSVRMLLTAYAEIDAAIAAINEGNIFRFLTKPCPTATFLQALQAGIDQYRLITSEKELLEQTLRGSVRVLTDVLAVVNPLAFGRASRIQRLVKNLADALALDNTWQFEVAALLSQIGCVTMPEALLTKVYSGEKLTIQEQEALRANSRISHELLAHIPRLEAVVESIAFQDHRFDGGGLPPSAKKGLKLPLGARLLKVALDLDSIELHGASRGQAVAILKQSASWYDPAILQALERLPPDESRFTAKSLRVADMRRTMILAQDIHTTNGIMLVRKHQEISSVLLHHLVSYSASGAIQEPIKVLVPNP